MTRKKRGICLVQYLYNSVKICGLDENLKSHLFMSVYSQSYSGHREEGGGRQWAVTYYSTLGHRRSQEDRECCSQKSTGVRRGLQPAHQRPAFPLPSQLLGKMEIPANLCLFSHSTNIPSPDCVWPRKRHLTGILKWLLVAVSFWGCFYKCANKFHMSSFVLLSLGL